MPRLHLTDVAVRALKPPTSGQVDYWDSVTRGFGVRVSQAGAKTFVAKVKNQRVTLGRYPDVSLADARRKANGVKSETQPLERSSVTFEQAYEKFRRHIPWPWCARSSNGVLARLGVMPHPRSMASN